MALSAVARQIDICVHDLAGTVFGGIYFITTLPKISHIYQLYKFRSELAQTLDPKDIDSFDFRQLAERCETVYPLASYATKLQLQEMERSVQAESAQPEDFTDNISSTYKGKLVQIEKLKKLLTNDIIHSCMDLAIGMMGGLLFVLYFVVKTAFLAVLGTVATSLFWGIWIATEVPKLVQAFDVQDPSRWGQLAKFVAALVIFGALAVAQLFLPIGLPSLVVAAVLGLLYLYSQYKCNSYIDEHTKKLDFERVPIKKPPEVIEFTDLSRVPQARLERLFEQAPVSNSSN